MADELIVVVDEYNKILKPEKRTSVIKNKLWKRSAGALIVDTERKKLLCHQRSIEKDERPGFWVATFGGKCLANELPIASAVRELNEELNASFSEGELIYFDVSKSESRRQFEYVYIAEVKSASFQYVPDSKEVASTRWIVLTEVSRAIASDKNWYKYGYEEAIIERYM